MPNRSAGGQGVSVTSASFDGRRGSEEDRGFLIDEDEEEALAELSTQQPPSAEMPTGGTETVTEEVFECQVGAAQRIITLTAICTAYKLPITLAQVTTDKVSGAMAVRHGAAPMSHPRPCLHACQAHQAHTRIPTRIYTLVSIQLRSPQMFRLIVEDAKCAFV